MAQAARAEPGHNSALTDDQRRALHFHHVGQYEKALEAKKAADAALKNVCKVIKAEGDSVDAVKLTVALQTPEGEARIKAEMQEQLRVMAWNGLPVGAQADMFTVDRSPLVDRAREEGRVAGMKGASCISPHDAGSEASNAWIEGWQAGQKTLIETLELTREGAKIVAAEDAGAGETPARRRGKRQTVEERVARNLAAANGTAPPAEEPGEDPFEG